MMRLSLSCALLLLPLVSSKKTWTLYHAWKGHDFSKRGSITLTLENSVPTLSVENVASATHLPSEDLYQLKLVEDGKEDSYTLTSVPACEVHRANFRYVPLHELFWTMHTLLLNAPRSTTKQLLLLRLLSLTLATKSP